MGARFQRCLDNYVDGSSQNEKAINQLKKSHYLHHAKHTSPSSIACMAWDSVHVSSGSSSITGGSGSLKMRETAKSRLREHVTKIDMVCLSMGTTTERN